MRAGRRSLGAIAYLDQELEVGILGNGLGAAVLLLVLMFNVNTHGFVLCQSEAREMSWDTSGSRSLAPTRQ